MCAVWKFLISIYCSHVDFCNGGRGESLEMGFSMPLIIGARDLFGVSSVGFVYSGTKHRGGRGV